MNEQHSARPTETHYYAGWPGKALCEGKTSLPVSPITSIRTDHVTCERCKEALRLNARTEQIMEEWKVGRLSP